MTQDQVKSTIQARKHIRTLQRKEPDIGVEFRWCPSHKAIEGNEKVGEWVKLADEEQDSHGVEWLRFQDHLGRNVTRCMPRPQSLANQTEEVQTHGQKQEETSILLYQHRVGYALTGEYLHQVTKSRSSAQCGWCERCNTKQTREHLFKKRPRHGKSSRRPCPRGHQTQQRLVQNLAALCRQEVYPSMYAVLDFLATTDVGMSVFRGRKKKKRAARHRSGEGEKAKSSSYGW